MGSHDDSCKPSCNDSHDAFDHGSKDYWGGNDPDWNMKNKSKKNGCFIASAVYGSPLASEVMRLRRFRDEQLLQSFGGRLFVKIYYTASPPIAKALQKSPNASRLIRRILDRFIATLAK